ncbi:hypothetical protein WQ64_26170, partial [Escherichia coli]
MKIIRCTVCVKSGVSCYGKESGWPDVQWHVSWRVWGLPGVSGGKKCGRPSAGKAVPRGTAENRRSGQDEPARPALLY